MQESSKSPGSTISGFGTQQSGNLLSKFRGLSNNNILNERDTPEDSINSDLGHDPTPNRHQTQLPQDAIKEESDSFDSLGSSNSLSSIDEMKQAVK